MVGRAGWPGGSAASEEESDHPCAVAVADGDVDVPLYLVQCFRPGTVCGADGVTYWCGCSMATCAGARVVRRGYGEVGAGFAPISVQALLLVHIVLLDFL